MATHNYKGNEIASINPAFMQVMYNDYLDFKDAVNMPKETEVNWCFFHKDQLYRVLNDFPDCSGFGFVYIANSGKIIYPTDAATGTDHASIKTIIAMMGVREDGTPLFLKKMPKGVSKVQEDDDVVITSQEPCPKVCNPPIPTPAMATIAPGSLSCFQQYYSSLKNANIIGLVTDAGFELDKSDFYSQYETYLNTRQSYQKFKSAYFSKDAINELLKDTSCIGIRCGIMLYYNSYRCMFAVGINNDTDRTWQWNKPILFSNLELNIPVRIQSII